MGRSKAGTFKNLFVVLMTLYAYMAAGQNSQPHTAVNDQGSSTAIMVTGQAFSAIKYSRKVRVLSDEKKQFIRNEHYPVQLARDSEGRVRRQNLENPLPECAQPTMPVPPICPGWGVYLFDPVAHTAATWTEGERAMHGAVFTLLSSAQMEEVERSTSVVPIDELKFDSELASIKTEQLGEKVIEGVRATGMRTTMVYPIGHSGNKAPITRIHEVWTSAEMRLVIRTIDGDPNGEESVSGLEKISLDPDPGLFQPPDRYEIQHMEPRCFSLRAYLSRLADWFAK